MKGALVARLAALCRAQPSRRLRTQKPAVKNPNDDMPAAPARGANSFTEEQAKTRVEGERLLPV